MSKCIEWTGCKDKDGYGIVKTAKNRDKKAHRVAWEEVHGPIPKGMLVLHRCDNPPCINVDHLWLGTNTDNMRDKVRKGRHRYGKKTAFKKGNKPPTTKINKRTAQRIRRLYKKTGESQTAIARKFGLTQQQVSNIVRGISW